MPFKEGEKRVANAGRRKGALNKRTRDLIEILDSHGYCPVAEFIKVAAIAEKEYRRSGDVFDLICKEKTLAGVKTPTFDNGPTYLQIMQRSAEGIMPFMYPKRKSVDIGPETQNFLSTLSQAFVRLDEQKKYADAITVNP